MAPRRCLCLHSREQPPHRSALAGHPQKEHLEEKENRNLETNRKRLMGNVSAHNDWARVWKIQDKPNASTEKVRLHKTRSVVIQYSFRQHVRHVIGERGKRTTRYRNPTAATRSEEEEEAAVFALHSSGSGSHDPSSARIFLPISFFNFDIFLGRQNVPSIPQPFSASDLERKIDQIAFIPKWPSPQFILPSRASHQSPSFHLPCADDTPITPQGNRRSFQFGFCSLNRHL